jgi:hypothetical protein
MIASFNAELPHLLKIFVCIPVLNCYRLFLFVLNELFTYKANSILSYNQARE